MFHDDEKKDNQFLADVLYYVSLLAFAACVVLVGVAITPMIDPEPGKTMAVLASVGMGMFGLAYHMLKLTRDC